MQSLTETVGHLLRARKLKLAAAESCTGGWLAKLVTDIAGSSTWFERGFVTYSNEAKMELLGVRIETLQAHGAVSEETVREMAAGALAHSRADVAVAITGIAGPNGGTAAKPIGTVWIAWTRRDAHMLSAHYLFNGDRGRIRRAAVVEALQGLIRFVR